MDKQKVSELARTCSLSCKKLIQDRQLTRKLTSPIVVLATLTVINLVTVTPMKRVWANPN
jgi:hypothetical protein